MKKITLFCLLMALSLANYAQKTDTVKRKSTVSGNNELKLNLLYTVLGLPEINYERILGDDMGLGAAVLFGADDDNNFNFAVIPHFRVYFGAKKASGFFVEANAAVVSVRERTYMYYSNTSSISSASTYQNSTNLGMGAAAGGKFLTKSGFIGEAYFGLGRIFGNEYEDVYPRLGITLGKRF